MNDTPTTLNGLLNRRVILEQPRDGYRIAIDTVFLAAAVPAQAGQQIMELGAGVGGAMLCLAARVPDTRITGIEIQPELVEIAQRNISRNNMLDRLLIHQGDVHTLPPNPIHDHVMINPPYYDNRRHDQSPHAIKRLANSTEQDALAEWIKVAKAALLPTGTLTLIHNATEALAIQTHLLRHFSRVELLDLIPKVNAPAKRILFRGSAGTGGLIACQPLVLHRESGGYSDEAESILRHLKSVNFTAV